MLLTPAGVILTIVLLLVAAFATNRLPARSKARPPRERQPGGEDTGGPSRSNFYNPVAEKVRVVEVPQGKTVNWNRGRCQTGNDREGDDGELRSSCGAHSGELFLEV